MVSAPGEFLPQVLDWVLRRRDLAAVTLFGSHARDPDAVNAADGWSDIDLHVIARQPDRFGRRTWAETQFLPRELRAYVVRPVPGGVRKVTALFRPHAELDIVVLPGLPLRVLRLAVAAGMHRRWPALARMLDELATVMRPGFRVLKGGPGWERFYATVVRDVRGTRLTDDAALALADEFVCDYVWILQKLSRGELITSQRLLHRSLAEINFQLSHELHLRQGRLSFREARRVEHALAAEDREDLTVRASLTTEELQCAVEKSAATLRKLMRALVADRWRWTE